MAELVVPGSAADGWLVLIGGGEFSFGETEEIDRFLLSKMPEGKRSVAFVPTASGSPEYARHFAEYLRKLEPSVEVTNVPIYRNRDARREKNLDLLFRAGMIYLGGGVTNALLEVINGSPAAEIMKTALRQGTLVAAIGAAAACAGTVTRDMRLAGATLPGLAWVAESVIETAWDPAQDDAMRRMLARDDVRTGYGIPRATALAIGPGRSGQIVGDGQVAVLRKPPAA